MNRQAFKNALCDLEDYTHKTDRYINASEEKFNIIDYIKCKPMFKYDVEESARMKNGRKMNCSSLRSFISILHSINLAVSDGVTTVISVGAPSSEFVVLVKLYPRIKFHFFKDPFSNKKFDNRIGRHNGNRTNNVKIYDGEIDSYDVKHLMKNALLVCNIRHGTMTKQGYHPMNKIADYQLFVMEILKPMCAIMKFSLPYEEGNTKYVHGLLFPPVYAKNNSTECFLLLGNDADIIEYNHDKYNDLMFTYNKMRNYDDSGWLDFSIMCKVLNSYLRMPNACTRVCLTSLIRCNLLQ